MRFARYPRLSRALVFLAVFQMFAPSVAAIADAWRMDQREPYAHMESETESTCVVVHAHDCALCSVATGPAGVVPLGPIPPALCRAAGNRPAAASVVASRAVRVTGSPRAPPAFVS